MLLFVVTLLGYAWRVGNEMPAQDALLGYSSAERLILAFATVAATVSSYLVVKRIFASSRGDPEETHEKTCGSLPAP